MKCKALYNYRTNRSKGKNVIVDILHLDKDDAEIRYGSCRKYVRTSKLKPYYDPDADGMQWLFLGYMICTQVHPKLPKFTIYNSQDEFVGHTFEFKEARQIVITNYNFNLLHWRML